MTNRAAPLAIASLALGAASMVLLVSAIISFWGIGVSTAATRALLAVASLGIVVSGVAAGLAWSAARRERRAADRRLLKKIDQEAAERARLESVLATITDGILVVDASGTVRDANAAALEILETNTTQPRGRRLVELTRASGIYEVAMDAVNHNRAGMREVELVPERRFLNVIALPIAPSSEQRSERQAVLVMKDVTQLHRVEVTRREFISNASHELRTPVAAIKASAETLQAGAIDNARDAGEFLERIVQDVDRMDRMLTELLELSRLESGQTPLHLVPVNLETFATDVAARFKPIAEARQVSLRTAVSRPAPFVTADLDKLHQLIANLITNAMKATHEGGSITLEAERTGGWIEMRVSDTGRGIEPQHLPHIFERFYKADRSRSGDGVGLGLAIARHIALVHQGEISVRSQLGNGSTFTVKLPVPVGFESAHS